MKPIKITKEEKIKVFEKLVEKFTKEMDQFQFNVNDTKMSFSFDFGSEAKEKVTVLYSQSAYLKIMALVNNFDTEVGWYGMCEKINDKLYRIYDVKMCKQYVTGSKVDTNDDEMINFFDSLSDEEIEHMHVQGHSHVNMSTAASGTDLQNQADVVRNMGKGGFYIFQIWNKKLDINTYLYDLDNNMFYDKKDIIIEIEDGDSTISGFIASIEDLVVEKKTYPHYKSEEKFDKKKEENNTEKRFLGDYWDGVYYPERWDW